MNDLYIIGIDPGATGAIAVLTPSKGLLFYPATAEGIRSVGFISPFSPFSVFLEKVHSLPGMPGQSMFKFGENVGELKGAMIALGIPWTEVTPQKWQAAFGLGGPYPDKKTRKSAHHAFIQSRFPGYDISKSAADACIIALYGRKITKGVSRL